MTAAAKLRSETHTHEGLRPLDARRDMKAVAQVIETAFAGQLDANGRRMIRDMKTLGRFGWIGWLAAQLILPPAAYPLGFVWEQGGSVVGNASLLPAERYPGRWVLANVAVLPEYRRRGIARALVTSAIDLAARRGGRELVLQVDQRSEHARRLYETLGFNVQTTRTTWWRSAGARLPQTETPLQIHPRRDEDWPQQYALARSLFPEGLVWPTPLRAEVFKPEPLSSALGLRRSRHWGWYKASGRIGATLTARLGVEARHWRFILLVAPDLQGVAEEGLLLHGLRELAGAQLPTTLDYPSDMAAQALASLGFHPQRSLTWMQMDLRTGTATTGAQIEHTE